MRGELWIVNFELGTSYKLAPAGEGNYEFWILILNFELGTSCKLAPAGDSLGVDVNKTLGSNSPFPNEKEFAVINKIPNENIVDTTHMKDIKKKKHH